MKIYSVYDDAFKPYGRIVEAPDSTELIEAMRSIPLPESGAAYEPAIESLERCAAFADYQNTFFGGMPVQLGMCWGHNTKLNALEYHRDSELNLGADDFVLLLAKLDEVEDFMLDTARVKAFRVPAGVLVEVYATSMHYAPCHANAETGFRTMIALPRGTNTPRLPTPCINKEDRYLVAKNKWVLAHPESSEAIRGECIVGLKGENIDIAGDI